MREKWTFLLTSSLLLLCDCEPNHNSNQRAEHACCCHGQVLQSAHLTILFKLPGEFSLHAIRTSARLLLLSSAECKTSHFCCTIRISFLMISCHSHQRSTPAALGTRCVACFAPGASNSAGGAPTLPHGARLNMPVTSSEHRSPVYCCSLMNSLVSLSLLL